MSNIKLDLTGIHDESAERKSRIRPGIHVCKILGVGHDTNQNGKQFISLQLENADGTRDHEEKFFLSTPAAVEWTKKRLVHMIDNVTGTKKELTEIDIAALNKLLKGKSGRFLFVGEEYVYNGDVRIKTMLNFLPFVENTSVEATKFDFNESRNIKKLKDSEKVSKPTELTAVELDKDLASEDIAF